MALAVCLLFDRRGERLVRELWARLEEQGIRTLQSHTHGRHHPHLSYAVLREWDAGLVDTALATLPPGEPVRLAFHGTVAFPRGRAALLPSIGAAVAARQERVASVLAATGADLHRHYAPGEWVPHVSVATRATGTALPVVVKAITDALPLRLVADRAAMIDSSSGEVWPLPHVL
jgi:2'-5' RNA ligase